ncbi:hypothetical protein QN375_17725 [Pseudomonas sp. MH9.2]|uniref:hypothetical protein n=1 Tax=Pseudomonas sp. MH9.2 TaxID=3048629 RepID=UPI002AC98430|nr:hypothetical protein [Pseudomonas sp. MH9.2]MEB0027593.1 hypothetical protein [Pseudomonas sp. MH9.2]WPX70349.1 hypothetical protein RHM55_07200 [Pseudomonas sp. MH9.2]
MARTSKSDVPASTQDQQGVTASVTPQAKEPQPETGGARRGVTIYPLRSYLDGKEIKRAGGEGYESPKHEAAQLIAKGLATDEKPGA